MDSQEQRAICQNGAGCADRLQGRCELSHPQQAHLVQERRGLPLIIDGHEVPLIETATTKIQNPNTAWFYNHSQHFRFYDNYPIKECSICLESYELEIMVARLYCTHSFHSSCIEEWLKLKSDCPLCKKDFRDHQEYKAHPDCPQIIALPPINHEEQQLNFIGNLNHFLNAHSWNSDIDYDGNDENDGYSAGYYQADEEEEDDGDEGDQDEEDDQGNMEEEAHQDGQGHAQDLSLENDQSEHAEASMDSEIQHEDEQEDAEPPSDQDQDQDQQQEQEANDHSWSAQDNYEDDCDQDIDHDMQFQEQEEEDYQGYNSDDYYIHHHNNYANYGNFGSLYDDGNSMYYDDNYDPYGMEDDGLGDDLDLEEDFDDYEDDGFDDCY